MAFSVVEPFGVGDERREAGNRSRLSGSSFAVPYRLCTVRAATSTST